MNSSGGTSSTESELILKTASKQDLPKILDYARRFWKFSPWRESPFSETIVREFAESYIDSDQAVIFLHDNGMIGGQIVPIFFGTGVIAHETFWWSSGQGTLLLECFEQWAKAQGAEKIMLTSLAFNNERDQEMIKFYDKLGYKPIEIHFAKEVI